MRSLRDLKPLPLPLSASLLLSSCQSVGELSPIAQGPAHHAAGGFRNLHVEDPDRNLFDFLAMRWFGDKQWADHAALPARERRRTSDEDSVSDQDVANPRRLVRRPERRPHLFVGEDPGNGGEGLQMLVGGHLGNEQTEDEVDGYVIG